jgi:hypothetical protein
LNCAKMPTCIGHFHCYRSKCGTQNRRLRLAGAALDKRPRFTPVVSATQSCSAKFSGIGNNSHFAGGAMAATIRISVCTNSDDAFVAWAPSEFIPGCRGFLLERARKNAAGAKVEPVENRVGFKKDNPKSGDHRSSSEWPFQRFNWTDHAVDVGNNVRYRVTAMIDDGSGRPYKKSAASKWTAWQKLSADAGGRILLLFQSRSCAVAVCRPVYARQETHGGAIQGAAQKERGPAIPRLSLRRSWGQDCRDTEGRQRSQDHAARGIVRTRR